jgi:TIR domain/Tetratricopeptide repeat/NB-ARC domain
VTEAKAGGRRVFVSYAGVDVGWGEWVGWQLAETGYEVELDRWDWGAGENFVAKMNAALAAADVVVALFSEAYFEPGRFTGVEWTSVVARREHLVPLRITEVAPPPVLAGLIWRDLFGKPEDQALGALLEAMAGPSGRPVQKPAFPDSPVSVAVPVGGPRLPGALPPVWNAPPRSPVFTGRDAMLERVRTGLRSEPVAVQALAGMGGVGKTLLAVEYAHRYAADYDVVWWMDAEQAGRIAEQLAQLAVETGAAPAGVDAPSGVKTARAWLRGHGRWLVVFDNAEDAAEVRPWLPDGPGHVLVTSRSSAWGGVATPIDVDVFARAESVALLHQLAPAVTGAEAGAVAEAVGNLPLAVAQAGGVLAETGMPARDYLRELGEHANLVYQQGAPADYPRSLAAAVGLAIDKVTGVDAAAAQLLAVCAFLAPEPVPLVWFSAAAASEQASALPEPLRATAGSPLALRNAVGRLGRYGLARPTDTGPLLHRATAALTRHHDDSGAGEDGRPTEADYRAAAIALLVSANPGDGRDPATWPIWATLTPHLQALDPATATRPDDLEGRLRNLAIRLAHYLDRRGDAPTARQLCERLYEQWRQAEPPATGPDGHDTLWAATFLAHTLQRLGDPTAARELDEDILARRRQALGEDHPDTLTSANDLGNDLRGLGEVAAARELDEDTLARRRRVLGEDHPETLTSAFNLAIDLYRLGEVAAARDLAGDILARRRRVLGEDHPDTLSSATNLAIYLSVLGEVAAARDMDQDTLARRQRVQGEDHPDTLTSANNLANDLRALGDHAAARELDEDTLARMRRVLGEDHPNTLTSAANLAADLRALGDCVAARELDQDTLARRRVLGADHPEVRAIADRLTADLRDGQDVSTRGGPTAG